MVLFLHSYNFFYQIFNLICLVIQDFVQKALFCEILAIRSGWGNYV